MVGNQCIVGACGRAFGFKLRAQAGINWRHCLRQWFNLQTGNFKIVGSLQSQRRPFQAAEHQLALNDRAGADRYHPALRNRVAAALRCQAAFTFHEVVNDVGVEQKNA